MTNETILILRLSTSPTLVAIYQPHLHMEYTFLNLFCSRELATPTRLCKTPPVSEQKVDQLGILVCQMIHDGLEL